MNGLPFVLLPIGLAAALGVALFLFVRQASHALSRSRSVDRFRVDVESLGLRMDEALAGLVARVDLVRRGDVQPEAIRTDVDGVLEELRSSYEAVQATELPAYLDHARDELLDAIAQGIRAVELIGQAGDVAGARHGREHALEAQTAVKRGYLNLLHARSAISDRIADMGRIQEPARRRWGTTRP